VTFDEAVSLLARRAAFATLDVATMARIPGLSKSSYGGQLPKLAGSPPMRTQVAVEGTPGALRTNIWNQPGEQVCASGGAVTVQVVPEQETRGKKCPLTHAVTVGERDSAKQGDLETNSATCDSEGIHLAVSPIPIRNGECWASRVTHQVRWNEDLDTLFLVVDVVFGIGVGNNDTAITEKNSF